ETKQQHVLDGHVLAAIIFTLQYPLVPASKKSQTARLAFLRRASFFQIISTQHLTFTTKRSPVLLEDEKYYRPAMHSPQELSYAEPSHQQRIAVRTELDRQDPIAAVDLDDTLVHGLPHQLGHG
ncbi:hypothetical protein, partial [Janthinobacterium sp. 551a]|uniref:hypothetical protein n=1 Tax=Janthinobacterium sp. 551a TaxID=1566281 RepID=UPI0020C90D25